MSRTRATPLAVAFIVIAACAAVMSISPASAFGVTVRVIPPTEGIRIAYGTRIYHSDSAGRVQLPASADQVQNGVKVLPTRLGPRVRASFGRVYKRGGSISVTLSFYYLVRLSYINLQGAGVDPGLVGTVQVKGVQGKFYAFHANQPRWLQGSRIVTSSTGSGFHLKPIDYGVVRVDIDRSNVVNAGQQRFLPMKVSDVRVRLLLYSATFQTRDAFFGFPIGSAIDVRYPSGRVERHQLDGDGTVSLTSLPRGQYKVKVRGRGFSFTRPVALSRNQVVKLQVLSYLDIGLVILVAAAFVVGLPLIQRPWLMPSWRGGYRLARLRARRRRKQGRGSAFEGGAG